MVLLQEFPGSKEAEIRRSQEIDLSGKESISFTIAAM
jgi:hypothetical protein